MSSATTTKKDKDAAMTGNKTKNKSKNKAVSSTSVLELYQEHHTSKKTHGQFLSALQRVGSYSSRNKHKTDSTDYLTMFQRDTGLGWTHFVQLHA